MICSAATDAFAALSATRPTRHAEAFPARRVALKFIIEFSDMQRHRQLIGLRQLLEGDRQRGFLGYYLALSVLSRNERRRRSEPLRTRRARAASPPGRWRRVLGCRALGDSTGGPSGKHGELATCAIGPRNP